MGLGAQSNLCGNTKYSSILGRNKTPCPVTHILAVIKKNKKKQKKKTVQGLIFVGFTDP